MAFPWSDRSGFSPRRARPARGRRPAARWRPVLDVLEDRLVPAVFTVTTTSDVDVMGQVTLRDAITMSNATSGGNTIDFDIEPAGIVETISLLSPLPAITNPVLIDGYSQPGSVPNSLTNGDNAAIFVQLDGSSAGVGTAGLSLTGSGITVRGLDITGFSGPGVACSGSTDAIVGDFLGVLVNGTTALGNATGVSLTGFINSVGGSTVDARNLISGNAGDGIDITGTAAVGIVMEGNLIGTERTATEADANGGNGITISAGASSNMIGGIGSGALNVISGNAFDGVLIGNTGTTDNLVENNAIGTDHAGTAAVGNGHDGVFIQDGAASNTIGGDSFDAVNLISGNAAAGIEIANSGTTNNLVQSDAIGTDVTGTVALGNGTAGIILESGASSNTIGNPTSEAVNLISGNGSDGIDIGGAGTSDNLIEQNAIGMDVTGTVALGNHNNGVTIENGATGNSIGGAAEGSGNIISGNGAHGVEITDPGTESNVVQGDLIGTDVTGTTALGNQGDGVLVQNSAAANDIGGAAVNIIRGNHAAGIVLTGAGTAENQVAGSVIGLDVSGTLDVANLGNGVTIENGAASNTIGGNAAGATNLISGNSLDGVEITGTGTDANVVAGNAIGTDQTGTVGKSNNVTGVVIDAGASGNTIGGVAAGDTNVISFNGVGGVILTDAGTADNVVEGNAIGTDVSGSQSLANGGAGVTIEAGASSNTIGGTAGSGINLISGNGGDGIDVTGAGTDNNSIVGNAIGIAALGTVALANGASGVHIEASAAATIVSNNLISGNTTAGVLIAGGELSMLTGNAIGTDVAGTGAVGNQGDGVNVTSGGIEIFNNLIAFNGRNGVTVDATNGVPILFNSITDNQGLGIGLVNGGNNSQPAPVLTMATTSGGQTTVEGTLTAAANAPYVIQLFANPGTSPTEGKVFLAHFAVTTDSAGTADISFQVAAVASGDTITATATDQSDNTSMFSNDVTAP